MAEQLNNLGGAPAGAAREGVDRKRVVVLLRSVVIASCAYLALAGDHELNPVALLAMVVFALSNVALALAPRRIFYANQFGPCLLLFDTAVILFGISWSHGVSQDLILAYFFTVFIVTIGETIGQIAIGGALIAAGYGYWLHESGNAGSTAEVWVRLPFFFLVSVFYASLIDQLKRERRRRELVEIENEHLRVVLDLAGLFSETHATHEFVHGIGRFVERTCPGLRCHMALGEPQTESTRRLVSFPLRAHGHSYGALVAESRAGRPLLSRERWLCQMVAHATAGALYAAEQSDAARSALQAKEQFLATISHEFRTPLHAILGYLDLVDTALPPGENGMLRESVERMRVNTCRLQHLLEEVLIFAEIRSGRRAVRVEPVSLRETIEELMPLARELCDGKPVTVACSVDAEADALRTDGRKLNRALGCLLSNAAKFTHAGEIRVSGRFLGDGLIEIAIADTGIGIAPGDLGVVFDEFRQVDGSFTRRFGGMGIGLTLARELVGLLGGTLDIASEVGTGTTVRVRLPQALGEAGEVVRLPRRTATAGAPMLAESA